MPRVAAAPAPVQTRVHCISLVMMRMGIGGMGAPAHTATGIAVWYVTRAVAAPAPAWAD